MYDIGVRKRAIQLRKQGRTYGEIRKVLGLSIPKSTLSVWCNGILLSRIEQSRLYQNQKERSSNGLAAAWAVNRTRRKKYLLSVEQRVSHLAELIEKNPQIGKVAVGMLYLGEGSKTRQGSLTFGNSSPDIIHLFLYLLRSSYTIDERKFRCTVQCRADQNAKGLERYWAKITKIPHGQFYKSRVDPRTIGRSSQKLEYRGVCRIDYFSADLFIELLKIGEIICRLGL